MITGWFGTVRVFGYRAGLHDTDEVTACTIKAGKIILFLRALNGYDRLGLAGAT
jgi:hypothetical protein